MSRFRTQYPITVPETLAGQLSLFERRSTAANLAALLSGGVGWVVGYALAGGGGTLLAFAVGGGVCGLVLGVAFSRALGGPAVNLLASIGWPGLLGGALAVAGGFPIARLYTVEVGIVLVAPAFFTTFACLLAWFALLGPERIGPWSRRHLPAPFLEGSENTP
jgi:hypothetical protein